MSFFDELGKRIGSASKGVAKKASEIADSAGVSVQIAGLERERDEIYRDLGKMYYERFGTSPAEEFREQCCKALGKNAEIQAAKQKYLRLKHVALCGNCGAENPEESQYCSKCGTKLSHEDATEAAAEETESAGTEPVETTEEPAHDAEI